MTITRTTLLDLPIITSGTETGVWGDITNNGLIQYLDIAVAGMTSLTSTDFTAGALTISTTEGDANATNIVDSSAQYATIKTSSLAQNSTITAPASNRSYRIINADSTYTLTIKASGQTGVTFLPGTTGIVAFNGTDYEIVGVVGAASATDNAIPKFDGTTGQIIQNTGVTIDDSNNVSGVAQLNATTADLTNIEVTNIKAKDGTAAGSIADSTGVVTLASSVLTTTDINGGTVDGVTIGGASAGAGTFTTLTATGNVTLGNAATDTVTITADVASNVIPSADNTYDLGASGSEWKDLYIDGTANIDSLVADTADINGGTIDGATIGGASAGAGSFTTLNTSGAVVFNDAGADVDFRVEGDTEANLLFVDASADAVGIGTSSPSSVARASFGNDSGTSPALYGAFFGTNSATSAAAPNFGLTIGWNKSNGGGESNIIYGVSAGSTPALAFSTSDGSTVTERMRIDSSGNVGIGTSSPAATYSRNLQITGSSNAGIRLTTNTYTSGFDIVQGADGNANVLNRNNYALIFGTNDTERARITSGGNLLVGTTNPSANTGAGVKLVATSGDGANAISVLGSADSNTYNSHHLYSSGAGAYRFYVGYGGTVFATNTTISAISDQRHKENIRDLDVGLDAVMQLKPRKFDWKDGKGKNIKDDRGFIAQEFEQVFPDLIDEWLDPAPEGEEPYKAVRQDLIPVLVKAIQELKAELDAAKERISALENA